MATTFAGLRTGGLAPENFLGNRPDFSKLGTAVAMANGLVDIADQRAENTIAVGKLNADTAGTQFLMNDMAKQAAQDVIDEGQPMRDLIGTGLNIASMFATGGLGGGEGGSPFGTEGQQIQNDFGNFFRNDQIQNDFGNFFRSQGGFGE